MPRLVWVFLLVNYHKIIYLYVIYILLKEALTLNPDLTFHRIQRGKKIIQAPHTGQLNYIRISFNAALEFQH